MAQQLLVSIYGQDNNDWGSIYGFGYGFPTDEIVILPVFPTVIMSTVIMKSKIKVLDGVTPYQQLPEFYTNKIVSDLVTSSNT